MSETEIPDAWPQGTVLDRGIVLGRAIGRGSWGIVYEATHPAWGRVAVKEYLPSHYAARASGGLSAKTPRWQEAVRQGMVDFRREAMALRDLQNRHVVRIFDLIEDKDTLFLVMDFLDGPTVEEAALTGDYDDPEAVMALGRILVDTLEAIHAENLLHRDIAPDNIIINKGRPVLFDFGAAGAAVSAVVRSSRGIVKDGYSPPEQYDDMGDAGLSVGPWSDIYAAGAVLHRLASRQEPPSAQSRLNVVSFGNRSDPMIALATLKPDGFPQSWLNAVDSALTLDPRNRPRTTADWRKIFEETSQTGRPSRPAEVSQPQQPKSPPPPKKPAKAVKEKPIPPAPPRQPVDSGFSQGVEANQDTGATTPDPEKKPKRISLPLSLAALAVVAVGGALIHFQPWVPPQAQAARAEADGRMDDAVREWELAFEEGDPSAGLRLGKIYSGGIGVPASQDLAVEWLTKAEAAGSTEAASLLGGIAANGMAGHWAPQGLGCGVDSLTITIREDKLVERPAEGAERSRQIVRTTEGVVEVQGDSTIDAYQLDGDTLWINKNAPDKVMTLTRCPESDR